MTRDSGMTVDKYLRLTSRCYTTLNGAQVLVDLFLLRVIFIVAPERRIVGLTGSEGSECVRITKPNNVLVFTPIMAAKFIP